MKPIIQFYTVLFLYLVSSIEEIDIIEELIKLSEKASPSWEVNEETIKFLEQCVNRPSSIGDDEELFTTINDFLKSSFKDLSVLKDSRAMEVFDRLARKVSPSYDCDGDMLIWARSVKERPDGSGVLVLHVTDLERFRSIIEDNTFADENTEDNSLEGVVLIGS